MPLVYEQEFHVLHTECDAWRRMTPGAALRRIQEISTAQCVALGIDEAVYARTHTVFLLSRLSLQVNRMPGVEQPVRLQTRAYGLKRALFHRQTSLFAADGTLLCEADTRWVLVDTENRRILRRIPEELSMFIMEVPEEGWHDMEMSKADGELRPLAALRADYSLCDANGHVNNTKYADILCDHLPLEKLAEGAPRRMLLVFRSEIPLAHDFTLHAAPAGEGQFFLAAEGDKRNFEGYVAF